MPTHHRRQIQLFSLLVTLCCTIVLLPSIGITSPNFGQNALVERASILLTPQTEDHAQFATPPQKAYDLLTQLEKRGGFPLPGYVGGREFQNRERRLPRGRYREYDVNPKIRGRGRDAERIVIEQRTGKAYYTGDHYRTFVPLN
ncbi:MAG: ribonuclease domain-containing protein [Nitrospira sp.]